VAAGALAEGLVSALEVVGLAFGYPHHPVGRDLDLRLEAGEIVALLGPNGSGKTTLFRTILGALRPTGGEVRVDGQSTATWPRSRLARWLAYVPQAHAGFFPFSALDVVLMGRTAHLRAFAVPSRRDREIAQEALDQLGVAGLAPRVFTELSGGERQLVLVARALAQAPRVLLMDEPAASLDFGNQIRLLEEVSALRQQGIAILMSTHHPDHARRVADRVVLMKRGVKVGEGPPSTLLAPDVVAGLYDIDVGRLPVAWPPSAAGKDQAS
jgi:iron complex transport system ATP-binding protein